MNLENEIKEWVSIDNKLHLLNEQIKDLRERKSNVNEKVVTFMENNHLENKTIQISDGYLKFGESKITAPLTFRYLEKSLAEIISNESQRKQIIQYLKDNRDVKTMREIKRFHININSNSKK
jgi:hypothetical protein